MNETKTRPLTVYVVEGKKKPRKTDKTVDGLKTLPPQVTVDGKKYYFSNADLVDDTATYVSVPITWQ